MTKSGFTNEATIGVIGLGIMGSSFATNLFSRGYNVHVYNRTEEKTKPLVERGATFHSTPRELASAADIIMTSLTDQDVVDSVAFGENGFLNGAKKGALWIDLSTINPTASIRHSEAAKQVGLERLDTPELEVRTWLQKENLSFWLEEAAKYFRSIKNFSTSLAKLQFT